MSDLRIMRAGIEHIDLLIKSRIDYCLRDQPDYTQQEYEVFSENVKQWTLDNVSNKSYIGYLGFIDNEIVCFAGILLYVLPPLFKKTNRKQGHVLSFFTYPKMRCMGHGNRLMKFIIQDSKVLGIDQLVLNATPIGEPLYIKCGFSEPKFKSMVISIT